MRLRNKRVRACVMAPIVVVGMAIAQTSPPTPPSNPSGETPAKDAPSKVKPSPTVTPAAPSQSGEPFEQKLAKVDAAMAKVIDLRADFEQKKKTALLKKPLVSRGTLVCKGDSVLWKTASPRVSSMLVGPEKVTVFYPEDKLAEVYAVGSSFRDAAGGPLPRLSKLKERFEIAELAAADLKAMGLDVGAMKDKVGLKLTPKSEELRRHVASVRVILDATVPCADRVVIIDPDGDETEIGFGAVKINSGVKDADLELALPEGTKVSTPTGGK